MLIAMTFHVGLFLVVVCGLTFAYFCFLRLERTLTRHEADDVVYATELGRRASNSEEVRLEMDLGSGAVEERTPIIQA
jgi:hypothetical protein